MKKHTIFTAAAIVLAAASTMTGCDKAKEATGLDANALLEQCGLACDVNAVAEGRGSISGIPKIDAYFTQVANFKANANLVAEGISAPLARIKAQLGLEASATPAQFNAALAAKYKLEGGIKIAYQPPQCQVSASATLQAKAQCEGKVDPGSATVSCEGRCEADVKVTGGKASCEGSAEMRCSAPSANVACTGKCNGTCNVTAGAECTGSCSGSCKGTCKGTCDGQATAGEAGASCAGKCEGTCTGGSCEGTCDVSATGTCSGTCEGSCEVTTTTGGCEGNAEVKCVVQPPTAGAKVECNAKCEGSVTPPSAQVECQASAKASAQMSAECTPPTVGIQYTFAATADATVKTQFETFKGTLAAELGATIAGLQKSKLVLDAGASLAANSVTLIDTFATELQNVTAEGDIKAMAGLSCAGQLLPAVPEAITGSAKTITDSVSGATTFVAGLK